MVGFEKDRVVLAGPETDDEFQRVGRLLGGFGPVVVYVTDGAELVRRLADMDTPPAAVILSAAMDDSDIGEVVNMIKEETDAEVIVGTTQNGREREVQARAAGIFCYLVLPTEEQHAPVALRAALVKHRARHRNDST